MGNIQTLADLIGMIRRRAAVIALVSVAGIVLTVIHALSLPRSYEAVAVIQVDRPRIAEELVREASGGPTSFRIQFIEQRIMSREGLLALMRRHGLAADLGGLTEAQQVFLMRESLRLDPIRSGSGGSTDVSAILVVARLGDPVKAAAVANDIADMVIDMGSARELQRIAESRAFFLEEEARIASAIVALEAEITRFKQANVDALPEALAARREEIARLDQALRDFAARRLELETRREAVVAPGNLRTVSVRLADQLAAEIALIDEQTAPLAARKAAIETSLARAPEVETTLSAFARELQQLQDRYAVTTRRLAEAETSRKLAENRQTEQFRLLEAAEPPPYATGSGRRRVAALGAAGAVLAGLGVALLLELLHPVLRTAGQMERAVGIRPVVSIPYVPTAAERVRRRTRRIAGLGLATFLLLAVVTVAGVYTLSA